MTLCWPAAEWAPRSWAAGSAGPAVAPRARLAPIIEPGPVEDTTTVTADAARVDRRRDREQRDLDQRDRDMQRLARTDLLQLNRDFRLLEPTRRDAPPRPVGPDDIEPDDGAAGTS